MNKYNIVLLAGLLAGGVYSLQARRRIHASVQTVMMCQDYNQVYNARGNVKNPGWYQSFEKKAHTERKRLGKADLVFSKQFVTTRVSPEILQKMKKSKLVPRDYAGSIVQVCRMYHTLE